MAELKFNLGDLLRDAGCSAAIVDVARERVRHVTEEGWTPQHDDEHIEGELAQAAMAYAQHSFDGDPDGFWWPWEDGFKPKSPREDLVRAAALIIAEIERLDRATNNVPSVSGDRGV